MASVAHQVQAAGEEITHDVVEHGEKEMCGRVEQADNGLTSLSDFFKVIA